MIEPPIPPPPPRATPRREHTVRNTPLPEQARRAGHIPSRDIMSPIRHARNEETVDNDKIEEGVRLILEGIGEDPQRAGFRDTPARVARMYEEVFAGIGEDPARHFETTFDEGHDGIVLVRDISFCSLCEHHLVPFFGSAHVAYLPAADGRICGLSKLVRLVETFARRPQVQERLTTQIADTLVEQLQPRGVIVMIEAEHMCMSMRGVKKPGAKTVTSVVRGAFERNKATRSEALSMILRS